MSPVSDSWGPAWLRRAFPTHQAVAITPPKIEQVTEPMQSDDEWICRAIEKDQELAAGSLRLSDPGNGHVVGPR